MYKICIQTHHAYMYNKNFKKAKNFSNEFLSFRTLTFNYLVYYYIKIYKKKDEKTFFFLAALGCLDPLSFTQSGL